MKENLAFKKTRIAPTPSGYLHLGNVLSFAITHALARKTGAKLFLRIDDADRERTNKLYVQDIFDTLNFLEIQWEEGPRNMEEYERQYSQVHRMNLYYDALQQLRDNDMLFACTCSRTDVAKRNKDHIYQGTCRHRGLPLDAKDVSWRIKTDHNTALSIKTLSGATIQSNLPETMRDFIVRKKDGFPAYQLTSLIDDVHFGIDLIVRGEDLWASTLAQQYLALQLKDHHLPDTTFYHHPLLVDEAGNKLSKSLGATSVQYLRKQHKKPTDIYSLIAAIPGLDMNIAGWKDVLEFV